MRSNASRGFVGAWLTVLLFSRDCTIAAEANLPTSAGPDGLVTAALKTELDGPTEARKQLLDEALRRDPDFPPARWQSGFVKIGGQWTKLDDVPARARSDQRLAEYRQKRDALIETADNHRALARWCRKNNLLDEERVHWAKVLEFEHNDAEAMSALGVHLYRGRLLTQRQIEESQKQEAARARAVQIWQPQFVKWRKAIEQGNAKQVEEARRGLGQFNDPDAIAALEATFAVNRMSHKGTELHRLLIETVGRIPGPEATQVLLREAVLPEPLELRKAAADQLKKRPMHAYVPLLIAALPGSMKTRFHVVILPNGMVSHEHELYIEGRQANYSLVYESTTNPADAAMAAFTTPATAAVEAARAQAIETRAEAAQARADRLRERLQFVLEHTTGFKRADDPNLWEKQYNDYFGWSTPEPYKPTYSQTVSSGQTYFSTPIDISRTTTLTNAPHSCFPAGTPVMTMMGTMPIEQVKVGDRVLSQDPNTGELAYKPVQATTLRSPTPLVKVGMGSNSILASIGHPFWVAGRGWQTARHLKVGNALHGLDGVTVVDNLEELPAIEVYNFVVSEFHTYFVGEARLLVHDNSPMAESVCTVPGLKREADSAATSSTR
jgi:hypothetical protein